MTDPQDPLRQELEEIEAKLLTVQHLLQRFNLLREQFLAERFELCD